MLIVLVGLAALVGAYLATRSHFGPESAIVTGIRIIMVACLTVPVCMVAAATFTDFREEAGKGVVFGALIAGGLAGVLNHPAVRRLLTRPIGKTTPQPTPLYPQGSRPSSKPSTSPPTERR